MLETKNLLKIYRPKKGVPVKALDGVSLKFPDKGMVFLLGKSGSGKSTLLNLLGGLDKYDGGEIIIKGVSSKKFKQQHFDSYRNTYVGFIFQEYNILEEFTVGANIALAIELQGRKASNDELNKILEEVDLAGYGNRRPNELSGGQKQRVAIARALVKNPKIIMADEPSGALDSVTGKQVFDTLKKLSKEKLVIVVSHDRDFAMEYADRIIELADGRVISDTSYSETAAEELQEKGISFEGATARIPLDYRLTEEDRIAINEYLEKLQEEGVLEFAHASAKNNFVPTDQEKIKSRDTSPFKLIKSKLSLKHAFKIGASGLKHKKFRLVMTILLSCVAFILFGLVDTFSSYDHIKTTANSVYDTGVKYASVSKLQKISYSDLDYYWDSYGTRFSDEEMIQLTQNTGIDFSGVISDDYTSYYFDTNLGTQSISDEIGGYYDLYASEFSGIVEIDESILREFGYELSAGRFPDGEKNEIAISEYLAESFKKRNYQPYSYNTKDDIYETSEEIKINSSSDMIGKTLLINNVEYTVTGIIDTKFDWSRYQSLTEDTKGDDASDTIIDFVLYSEFRSAVSDNFTGMMMTGTGFIRRYLEDMGSFSQLNDGYIDIYNEAGFYIYPTFYGKLSEIDPSDVIWLNGEKTVLKENEIILSADAVVDYLIFDENNGFQADSKLAALSLTMNYYNFYSGDSSLTENVKIVGVIDNSASVNSRYDCCILSDSVFDKYFSASDGIYNMALGAMPTDKKDIEALAEYCYTEKGDIKYALNNPASFELDALNEVLEILADVFLYIGIFFAVFASILLSNFIATSVAYKKQEIGILRAIGSRGNDVFRIFFSEAFIIAVINFVLASIGTGIITAVINAVTRDSLGLLVTILNFGPRQMLLIFAVSVGVAALASFLPVKKIASKRPIDAIRNR